MTGKDFGCVRNVYRRADSVGGLKIDEESRQFWRRMSFKCCWRLATRRPGMRRRCGVASVQRA